MTEFRPSRFQILPTIIKNLLIINVLVFLAQITIGPAIRLEDAFALHTWQSPYFKPWQFLTHMFMHGGWDHLFFNMFALWMFGSILENVWGPKRFLIFYLICGLGAALCHMVVLYFNTQNLIEAYNSLSLMHTKHERKKTFTPKMLYSVNLQELVPENSFYRRLLSALALHWLHKETTEYYGTEGQESIDPVVFFKICMVGYINNIASDRKLIEFCEAGFVYFWV